MNFELFEAMSPQEAEDHLRGFLETERVALEIMRPAADLAQIPLDYSVASLPPFLKWIMNRVTVVRVPVPDTEPDWIREAHKEGFIEFDEPSKYLILRAAYYLGETFVRTYCPLHWTIGNPNHIEKNMPVVAGFSNDSEMAPMMIVENLFTRILGRGSNIKDVDVAVSMWVADVN